MKLTGLLLSRGESLAPKHEIHSFEDFIVGITNYKAPIETGVLHSHENPMISLVLKGRNVEYRKGIKLERIPGSINFYNAYEPHKNIYEMFPSRHISIEVEKQFLIDHQLTENHINYVINKSPISKFILLNILKETLNNDQLSNISIKMLLLEMASNAVDIKEYEYHPNWSTKIIEILNDRWDENPTLKELSKELSVHPITISKNFRKYYGCSLTDYIRKLKISKSLPLLNDKNLRLVDVAYSCGFYDQSHFIKVFRHQTGFSPKEFNQL